MKLRYKVILTVLFPEFVAGYYVIKKLFDYLQTRREIVVT